MDMKPVTLAKKSIIITSILIFVTLITFARGYAFDEDALILRIDDDFSRLLLYIEGIESVMSKIEERHDLFDVEKPGDIGRKDKEELIRLWVSYLDHQIALAKLIDDYKHFYQINYFTQREEHAKAYLISYAAYVTVYNNGTKFIDLSIDNKVIDKILNDSYVEYGVPAGMYSKLKWNVLHVHDVIRLTAGYGHYRFLYKEFVKMQLTKKHKGLFSHIESSYRLSTKKLKKEAIILFPKNGLKIFKEKTYTVWFPIQKFVAKKMGETRVTRRHENFITEDQIKTMRKALEPGDILLERRNWYTSNIGIPGFWPHAALYLGNYDELVSYFDTREVKKYLKSRGFTEIGEFIKDINEPFYKKYVTGGYDVYEAVAPGVILKPLIESAKADYVGVMRPRVSTLDKFMSLAQAMRHFGKPYDYHFDFISDSAIVCSELVYKAYEGIIDFELKRQLGRYAVTATDFAEKFDKEFDNGDKQLDFVYFLDGSEDTKSASVKGADALRKTWLRPKWDIKQK